MTQTLPTISIVIPAYNEERHLLACLKAIAAQTVQPFEVVVVDNNSTDTTAAIARSFPFVTLIQEQYQGRVFARNAGMNKARGKLIARIDADTRIPPDWIARALAYAEAHPDTYAFTGRGYFYDTPLQRLLGTLQIFAYQYVQWPAIRSYTLWGSNMVIKRTAWRAVRSSCKQRLDFDEDVDLTIHLKDMGYRIDYTSSLVVGVSMLHGNTGTKNIWQYLSTWPRDYWVNGKKWATVYISLITFVTGVVGSLIAVSVTIIKRLAAGSRRLFR